MTILGIVVLVASSFFLGWHFLQSRKDVLQQPIICSNARFMAWSWLIGVVSGVVGAVLIAFGAGLWWGLLGLVGVFILPAPFSFVHHLIYLGLRRHDIKKMNREFHDFDTK